MKALTKESKFDGTFSALWILSVRVVNSQAMNVAAIKHPNDASQTLSKQIQVDKLFTSVYVPQFIIPLTHLKRDGFSILPPRQEQCST